MRQELLVIDKGLTFTLYDIAKRYDKDHRILMKQFNEDIALLTAESKKSVWFNTVPVTIDGTTISTHEVNVETAIWLAAKFSSEFRSQIIDYAFEKLEKIDTKTPLSKPLKSKTETMVTQAKLVITIEIKTGEI